jgi:GH25 family lysozyme M1 (1,4-beta-N-acetylmuramidase)
MKLSLHLIGPPEEWVYWFVDAGHPTTVKGMIWYPNFMGAESVCRIYMSETREPESLSSYIIRGEAGANDFFKVIRPELEKTPPNSKVEPYNESPIWNAAVLCGFEDFNQRLIQLFHTAGRKIIVGAINTYWPRPYQYHAVYSACKGADGLSFHEYSPLSFMVGHPDICHYRTFHEWGMERGLSHPPIYITECGLDTATLGGVPGPDHGHWGWHGILKNNEDAFVAVLADYERELQKDDYVVGAHIFTTGGDWPQFQFGKSAAQKLIEKVKETKERPRAIGVDISEFQDAISPDTVWDWGARFVIMRLGDGLYKDPYFDRNWKVFGDRGFLRGCYHVLRPDKDKQADFVRKVLAGRKPEMGLWGDYEVGGLTADRISRYVVHVERQTGMKPNTYSRANLLNYWSPLPPIITATNLWISSPGKTAPVLPAAWSTWKLWQYGQRVIGTYLVDVNYYNGTTEELHREYGNTNKSEGLVGAIYLWYAGEYKKRPDGKTVVTEAEFKQEVGNFPVTVGGEYHAAEFQAVTGPATFPVRPPCPVLAMKRRAWLVSPRKRAMLSSP